VTFSIVARDPQSGELGVAVQTAMFAAGAVVPWARPGVGAVASQAIGEPAYGTWCLDALADGSTATDALAAGCAADPAPDLRQVAVVSAQGDVAATTGALCIGHAGHLIGDGFSVQANMVTSPRVWPAMADAFVGATGPLARRLHAALLAGQEAGGDARGAMSAALLVVSGSLPDSPGAGVVVDLRVDRAERPIDELARLLAAAEAYAEHDAAVEQLMSGDPVGARLRLDRALAELPGEENLRFVRAGALATSGDLDGAAADLRALVARRPSWRVVIEGFAAAGLLELPPGMSVDAALRDGQTTD
jgi:uncharacterized Ntn-hydrolase superfamily protein